MSGHVRGDVRKRSLESQHRLKIEQGLIVSCMCGAATNTDPYGDAITAHIIAEARADGANTVLEAVEAELSAEEERLAPFGPDASGLLGNWLGGIRIARDVARAAVGGVR